MLSVFIPLAIALFAPSASASINKAKLFKNGLHDPLIGLSNLPAPGYSIAGVGVPSLCTQHAASSGCPANQVQAYQVHYGDCSEPWTLCRCANAQMNINDIAHRFGQVPPGVRSYVGGLLAVSANSCSAGSGGDFIVFNGDCSQSVFDHESSHSLDKGTSGSAVWNNALARSSCVPDDYAATSNAEDFAQVSVCNIYLKRVGALPANPACMQPQLDVFNTDGRISSANGAGVCNKGVRPFQLSKNAVSDVRLDNATYTGPIKLTYFHENPVRE